MNKSDQKITGILLAGGMSSRMGREKGSMLIGTKMMYEYPLSVLESVCDEVLISSCQPLPAQLTHPRVCDKMKGIGPIGGIHTCLEHSSTDINIVLSYDMPIVNEGLLRYLISRSQGWDIVVPAMRPDQVEPLCALYRKSISGVLEALIKEKKYAVRQALPKVASRVLNIRADMPFYHPELFLNINRMEDLGRIPENLGNEE
jgi:molybdopterin-guanine dinucleotide biosynthesis protein A